MCAIAERGPEEISFYSDIFGSELKSRSDVVEGDREESHLWFEDTSFMLDKSGDAGKELDIFMVSATTEQLHNSGEEHSREKRPESIENEHAAINNASTGDDNESHMKSEANKDADQKVDCYNNNKSGEDFTSTGS